MFKKFFFVIFGLLMSFAFVGTSFSQSVETIEPEKVIIDNLTQQRIENIGILPDSKLYWFKIAKENLIGLFKFKEKKTRYVIELSQNRLAEGYLMAKKQNAKSLDKALLNYQKQLSKLENKDLTQYSSQINMNNRTIEMLVVLYNSREIKNFDMVVNSTAGLTPKKINESLAQGETQLSGKVLSNTDSCNWVENGNTKVCILKVRDSGLKESKGDYTTEMNLPIGSEVKVFYKESAKKTVENFSYIMPVRIEKGGE